MVAQEDAAYLSWMARLMSRLGNGTRLEGGCKVVLVHDWGLWTGESHHDVFVSVLENEDLECLECVVERRRGGCWGGGETQF